MSAVCAAIYLSAQLQPTCCSSKVEFQLPNGSRRSNQVDDTND